MTEQIHSCSYYCDRPECIKAQRDELRSRLREANKEIDDLLALSVIQEKLPVPRLRAQLLTAQAECEEQARLLGMSGEREAGLLAQIERLNRERDEWKAKAEIDAGQCQMLDETVGRLLENLDAYTLEFADYKAGYDELLRKIDALEPVATVQIWNESMSIKDRWMYELVGDRVKNLSAGEYKLYSLEGIKK